LRHFLWNDLRLLKDFIQDIITTSPSLPRRCTITPIAKFNLEVASWTTTRKATTAGSSLVFEDNFGKDGLSSQSTYKVNIDCLYYKASITPNQKILNDLKPSKEQLEKVYGGIMKEVNDLWSFHCSKSKAMNDFEPSKEQLKKFMVELWKKWMTCGCELLVKIPNLPLIVKAKPSILILPKFKPKTGFLASWWYWIIWLDIYKQICKILVLWGYLTLIYSQTSNGKAIQKSTNANLSSKLFQDDSNNEKKSVGWVCVFTQKGHTVDILPYSQLCCSPYWFAEEHNCDMHPYSM
jgi:hypothetical protein